jgi:glyoxylase-like metal-dependent hydrolase (beta-lactamase superfamily II)
MIIDQPGKVTETITLLGTQEHCVYLVDGGDACALLGGGLAAIVPAVDAQLAGMDVDPERIQYLVIQHSHFDHCGIVPYFKKKWPWVQIVASERARTILSNPKAVASIEAFNTRHLKEVSPQVDPRDMCLEGFTIDVEKVVAEGEVLACGNLSLEVLETPGHSTCSISVYMPEERAMFASDAVGISLGDKVFTAANSNFDQYQESIEKIFAFNPDILLSEHRGCRTGEDCRTFMSACRRSAREMRQLVEQSFARTNDVEKSTDEIAGLFMATAPKGMLPMWVVKLVVSSMVHQVSRRVSTV